VECSTGRADTRPTLTSRHFTTAIGLSLERRRSENYHASNAAGKVSRPYRRGWLLLRLVQPIRPPRKRALPFSAIEKGGGERAGRHKEAGSSPPTQKPKKNLKRNRKYSKNTHQARAENQTKSHQTEPNRTKPKQDKPKQKKKRKNNRTMARRTAKAKAQHEPPRRARKPLLTLHKWRRCMSRDDLSTHAPRWRPRAAHANSAHTRTRRKSNPLRVAFTTHRAITPRSAGVGTKTACS